MRATRFSVTGFMKGNIKISKFFNIFTYLVVDIIDTCHGATSIWLMSEENELQNGRHFVLASLVLTHICVSKLTILGSDNGLSPGRRQAIISTNAGMLLIGPLGTNLIEILITIQTFSFKKMHLKMLSAKWCPYSLNVFNVLSTRYHI